ncbi:MAG: FkbM family methyltransferase [Bacteroidetes bacterium]|nr:FkbM family methyltransferase [Bacteroidota bacterium]
MIKKIIKNTYASLPYKKQFLNFIKKIYTPPEHIYRHLYFKGTFKVNVDSQYNFRINHYGYQIENEIFWGGLKNGWEKVSINLWIKLCKNSSIVIDIGSNTGVYALLAKTINPSAKVYAFEPVNRVFAKLKENINLNNYDITAIEKAVSNSDGFATIYDTNSEHTNSVTVNKNLSSSDIKVIETKIETITLNSFIKNHDIEKIDLIKIDVETHEPEVLEGFSEYLKIFRPTFLIEILNDEIGERVNKIVKGLDYLYFNIDDRKGSIRQTNNITHSDYYNYLLCNVYTANKLGLIT